MKPFDGRWLCPATFAKRIPKSGDLSRVDTTEDSANSLRSSIRRLKRLQSPTDVAQITILPQQATADVADGTLLLDAGEAAGVDMEAGCFNCSCGTCVAEVVSGGENLSEPTSEELDVLDQWNKDPEKYRLTCCVTLDRGSVTLRQSH